MRVMLEKNLLHAAKTPRKRNHLKLIQPLPRKTNHCALVESRFNTAKIGIG